VVPISVSDPDKPLRRDAARNRQRILDAARELFAQRGLSVTLNDIAHHAGVGVGTVYRRFPDKTELIDGLFEQRIELLAELMTAALEDPDPLHGLSHFMERALELLAADRALKELVTASPRGLDRIARVRERLFPLGSRLIARAQESGQLRDDIGPTDLPVIQLILTTIIDAARDVQPDLWRRYLQLVLRGMASDPDALGPLAIGPLAPTQVDGVMSHLGQRRR
jgi:AcrR family transcriptional regulator